MSIRVYIAASSDEWAKAKCWADKLRAAGVTVVSTWTESLPASGQPANPRWDPALCYRAASQCLREVDACDVLWLIAPDNGHGRGAYFEAGAAHALGKRIIASGDVEQSVFSSRLLVYASHEEAFEWLTSSHVHLVLRPCFSKRWGNWGEA